MINTERNRALLTDLFAALGREGWGEVFLAALRDDAASGRCISLACWRFRCPVELPMSRSGRSCRVAADEVIE